MQTVQVLELKRCGCDRKHRTDAAFAKCAAKSDGSSVSVSGYGPYGFLHSLSCSCCGDQDEITLYSSLAEAKGETFRHVSMGKCCGSCSGHFLVVLHGKSFS